MRNIWGNVFAYLMALSQMLSPVAMAADTSIAVLNISGNVPTVFSVTARGLPGDLDLTPNVSVANRLLGILHFKYNADVASMTLASSTASGVPEKSGTAYGFGAAGFKVAVTAGCSSVDATYNTAFLLTNAGVDVKSAAAATLTAGVEEDCSLTATWAGTTSTLPLAGKYSMVINLTMISN